MTKRYETFQIHKTGVMNDLFENGPTKPDLLYPFKYSQASMFGEFRPKERDFIPPHDIVQRMAERFLNCVRCEFPLLPEGLWVCFLKAGSSRTELTLAEIEFLIEDGFENYTNAVKPVLSSIQKTAISMVLENYWSVANEMDADLRKVVSSLSGRPEFSVFSNDPATIDCWILQSVELEECGTSGVVWVTHTHISDLKSKFRVSCLNQGRDVKVERLRGAWDDRVASAEPFGGEDWTEIRRRVGRHFLGELKTFERQEKESKVQ